MSSKYLRKMVAFLLGLISIISLSLSAYAETGDTKTIENATYYLYPYETAVSALNDLVKSQDIYALVYLSDAYSIKVDADPNSETAATVDSGQQVKIVGVSQDSGKNIWYQVTYTYDDGSISGYIEREYLAFADEKLLEWEGTYVRSRLRSLFFSNNYAASDDIEQFPESYQSSLYALKEKHPEWTFVKMNTGIDWNSVVATQSEGARSLIWASSAKESWKNGMFDKSWAYCTQGIVKYYLDPRNSLTELSVFQFEQLAYNDSYHTVDATQQVLNNTFMSGLVAGTSKTYASVFTEAGANVNISPILLASRVRQEQGTAGTSPLISGTYPGYEGLYNYYNIGASGQTLEAVAVSGLTKAREKGWTSRMASLSSGASFLLGSYINHGQDTLYLQKFDVDNRYDGILWHQYMQNLQAPTWEAKSTYSAYNKAGVISSAPFVFRIPVYNNMSSYACIQPGSEDTITLNTTSVTNLPVGENAVLTTFINGTQNNSVEMEFTSSNSSIATVESTGVIKGISPGKITITCKKKENPESANVVTCEVTVIKADIEIASIESPNLNEIVYNSGTTLKDIVLPTGFAWVDESIVPIVENSGYSVLYNPDSSKYNTLTFTIPLTVKKALVLQSSITIPKNLQAVAGQEVKSVALPEGFTWEQPNEILPKKVGTYSYPASYCMDVANYEVTTGIEIPVTVVCKTHEFEEWTGTHADCTHDGSLTRTCSICGEKETITETALGHLYQNEVTKEPTDKTDGIRTFTCSRCGDTYTEIIKATGTKHEHSYTETVTKQPTCTEPGEKTFTCSCGDKYTQSIEPLGHDLVNGVCSRCGYTIPSLPSHTHSYTVSKTTATCTETGLTTYICSCGDSYTESAPALGHNMVNGVCTRCGYSTVTPTVKPTATPTVKPTATPTAIPTVKPTATSTVKPTATPTTAPITSSTTVATEKPTKAPVAQPTTAPAVAQAEPIQSTKVAPVANDTSTESTLNIVRINMQESTILTSDRIGKIAKDDESLLLVLPDNISWDIDIASIENKDDMNIDMAVLLGKADIPESVIDAVVEGKTYELMSLAYDGPFEFDADLSIPVEEKYQGMIANLFYFNPDSGQLEFIGASNITKDGYAVFNMKHASDYMIAFANASMENVIAETEEATSSEEVAEAFNEQNNNDNLKETNNIENIILIIAVIVLIVVFLVVTAIIIKTRSKKDNYYFDEEDDLK